MKIKLNQIKIAGSSVAFSEAKAIPVYSDWKSFHSMIFDIQKYVKTTGDEVSRADDALALHYKDGIARFGFISNYAKPWTFRVSLEIELTLDNYLDIMIKNHLLDPHNTDLVKYLNINNKQVN